MGTSHRPRCRSWDLILRTLRSSSKRFQQGNNMCDETPGEGWWVACSCEEIN